jgi:hypothetical protein
MKIFLSLFLLLNLIILKQADAQVELCRDINKEKQGTVTIHADPKLNELINQTKNTLKDKPVEFPGFRVQVYNGTDRNEANRVKTQLLQLFSGYDVYLKYEQPRFKVRIGDFRNKIEAQKLYTDLRTSFEGVFIVPEKIGFPKLDHNF